jgi:hypothetical protein
VTTVTIGSSIFMIVVGAILRYAVTWRIHGVNLPTLGLILAIAGIVTLVLRLIWLFNPQLGDARPPLEAPAPTACWPTTTADPVPPHGAQPPPSAVSPSGLENWRPPHYSE